MQTHLQVTLPRELAPSLAERALRLLSEVRTTAAPPLVREGHDPHRCVVCHRGGKLGGHHGAGGRVEWIHRSCHRRLHRRGRDALDLPVRPALAC